MTTKMKPEDRVFVLRHDDAFEDLLLEALRRTSLLNKAVITERIPIEEVREFAYRSVEAAFIREKKRTRELSHEEQRYVMYIQMVLDAGAVSVAHKEQHDALLCWFRFMLAELKLKMKPEDAFHVFTLVAPTMADALVSLQQTFDNAVTLVGERVARLVTTEETKS